MEIIWNLGAKIRLALGYRPIIPNKFHLESICCSTKNSVSYMGHSPLRYPDKEVGALAKNLQSILSKLITESVKRGNF